MSKPLIKNCSECQKTIRDGLKDCQDWEVKKKEAYQKIQEEKCWNGITETYTNDSGVPTTTTHNHESGIQKELDKHKTWTSGGVPQVVYSHCDKCNANWKNGSNYFGDEVKEEHDNCNSKPNNDGPRERERERERILQYFKQHNIKSAKLEGNNLIIEYNNQQKETKPINTTETKRIKSYAEKLNKSELSLSDLEQSNDQSNAPNNKGLYIGLAVVGVLGIVIITWLLMRSKREK